MSTRFYRAFASEFLKISHDLGDAGIRKLLAERRGDEYLEGGKLPGTEEPHLDRYELHSNGYEMPKQAFNSMMMAQLGSTGNPLGRANKKREGRYQEARDWAHTALKGATGGVGTGGLIAALKGTKEVSLGKVRAAAGIGTAIALGDRAYRYHQDKKSPKEPEKAKTAAPVAPTPGPLRSPSTQLAASRRTGGFKSRVVRSNLGTPPKVVQLGQKFRRL